MRPRGRRLTRGLCVRPRQRNCVGQRFAMLEATVLFAIILRGCKLSLPEGAPPLETIPAGVVQKPKNGIWMLVAPRA